MLSFEDHERLHGGEQLEKQGPARDHEITRAGPPVPQVAATTHHDLDLLQPEAGRRALRERDARSDVIPEPILLLPDGLEVNTSVAVEESCDIGRIRLFHYVLAFPRCCPERTVRL